MPATVSLFHRLTRPARHVVTAALLAAGAITAAQAGATIGGEPVMTDMENVQADIAILQDKRIPMLVFFHATYCTYCRTVDEEFLDSMAEEPEYDGRLIIRRVEIDSPLPEIEWQGESWTPQEFARVQGVQLVPTVIFFGPDGRQLGDELKGVTVPDFYPAYLDARLKTAEDCIESPDKAACTEDIDQPRRDLTPDD